MNSVHKFIAACALVLASMPLAAQVTYGSMKRIKAYNGNYLVEPSTSGGSSQGDAGHSLFEICSPWGKTGPLCYGDRIALKNAVPDLPSGWDDGNVEIQPYRGFFVTLGRDQSVYLNRTRAIGPEETITICSPDDPTGNLIKSPIQVGGKVCFKSSSNKWMTAEDDKRRVTVNRDKVGEWEIFVLN